VLISSVAGQHGNPLMAPYAMSKHAIEGFSESLRRKLALFGIEVVIIGPGAVKTPIWQKAEQVDIARFSNSPYLPALERLRAFLLAFSAQGLAAGQVGELVHTALTVPNPNALRDRAKSWPDAAAAAAAETRRRPDH